MRISRIRLSDKEALIHKPEPEGGAATPQPRPMTPEVILRAQSQIAIGDILLETTDGQHLAWRRVARPHAEQRRILEALQLELAERLSQGRLLSWRPTASAHGIPEKLNVSPRELRKFG